MNTVLIVLTLVEVLLLVVVLAGYLTVIAATLRDVSKTLGLVTFGVRAIAKQTESIGPRVLEINRVLEGAAGEFERETGAAVGGETGTAGQEAGGTGTQEDTRPIHMRSGRRGSIR